MNLNDFLDASLVVFGHGSSVNADSAAPVFQHATSLRRRSLFAEIREGFWKQEPLLSNVVSSLQTRQAFLVPLLMSEGYFSDRIIPESLGFASETGPGQTRIQRRGGQMLAYCAPVGTHDRMTDVVLTRAREIVERFPFPCLPVPEETTLVVVGHGTGQNENSRRAIEHHVEAIRSRRCYAAAHAVFLEESPRVSDCYLLARTRHVVVVPFFIGEGSHVREDIPTLLGASKGTVRRRVAEGRATWRNPTEKQGKLVWCSLPVGTDPLVSEIILDRVREAAQFVATGLLCPSWSELA